MFKVSWAVADPRAESARGRKCSSATFAQFETRDWLGRGKEAQRVRHGKRTGGENGEFHLSPHAFPASVRCAKQSATSPRRR